MWGPMNPQIWGVLFTANLPLCWICSFNETSPKMEQNSWDANISQMWHAQRWCDKCQCCQCCQCPQLSHFIKAIILLGEILKVVWSLLDCWLHAAFLVTENTWRGEHEFLVSPPPMPSLKRRWVSSPVIYNDRQWSCGKKKNESGSVRTPVTLAFGDHLPFFVYTLDSYKWSSFNAMGCKMLVLNL